MPIYRLAADRIEQVPAARFVDVGVRERTDLQRLLRDQIDLVSPSSLVIAEEFGEWSEGNRRIDLLAVDRDGGLVIVELKRTEDGGHMDLQAVRYASFVSSMSFEQAADALGHYLRGRGRDEDARGVLSDFLDAGAGEDFGATVRIVLVSADFSKELTTSVIWLNGQGLDIRCVRLRPYALDDKTLLDIQQVLPLPEASEYQIRIREKRVQERIARESGKDFTRYDVVIDGQTFSNLNKRNAAFQSFSSMIRKGVDPGELASFLKRNDLFISAAGELGQEELLGALGGVHSQDRLKRYRTDTVDLLRVGNVTYALTRMWGGNIDAMVGEAVDRFRTTGIDCWKASDSVADGVVDED